MINAAIKATKEVDRYAATSPIIETKSIFNPTRKNINPMMANTVAVTVNKKPLALLKKSA